MGHRGGRVQSPLSRNLPSAGVRKASLSVSLLGVFEKLPCLSFPVSMENITMTTCLIRNPETWGRDMCVVVAQA